MANIKITDLHTQSVELEKRDLRAVIGGQTGQIQGIVDGKKVYVDYVCVRFPCYPWEYDQLSRV
ncbi:hypothetical protein LC607_22260 [Nostoc sp. CHAB 5824]|nr:hypothetical protein [Nostoc sp. CHAB 5824]